MADLVKTLRELLDDPAVRCFCGIPANAEVDEEALDAIDKWANEPIELSSLVVALCECGQIDYYTSFSESPSICPSCFQDLVIRNQTDASEIINPITTVN
jgi:altronate dehydratase